MPAIDVALDVRVTARMSYGMRAYTEELAARLPRVAPDLTVVHLSGGANLSCDEQLGLPRRVASLAPRLTHYPTIYAPVLAPQPYVLTIHDLIHVAFPQFYSRQVALYFATVARRLARRARLLCMGDERTVELCERYLGVPAERCRVVPLGFEEVAAEPERGPRPYFLYAGNLRPHKNVAALLAAWSALPPGIEVDLYLAGTQEAALLGAFDGPRRRLRVLGTVSRERLWALYRGALAYVHPALAEGFGIPMLEAMAAGTPVIASRESVPSMVRPHAALFEARDVAGLRDRLLDAAEHPAAWRERALRGMRNVQAYTWDRFAASTAAVYREILGEAPFR